MSNISEFSLQKRIPSVVIALIIASFCCCGCAHSDSNIATVSSKTGSTPISEKSSANHAPTDQAVSHRKEADSTAIHEPFMRQAFALAISAAKKGNHPYGALLVYQGRVILTSENTVNTDDDISRHAELSLLVRAKKVLPADVVRQSTLYTSSAPCMICCTLMIYRGINKIVYGVSYEAFAKLTGFKDTNIPCNRLYQEAGKSVAWTGPILEDEGLKVLQFWPAGDPNSKYFHQRR